jgi:Raf kinase inhibitor-like YbhB/YbcL family protein
MAFTLTSPMFADGQPIPAQFTCDGTDTPPPLQVTDAPEGTRSFALIMDDPDAPNGTFTHWLAYDIPSTGAGSSERAELQATAGRTLLNGFGRSGYGGPCPPRGHGSHRYYFTLHALDVSSLDLPGTTRDDLEAAVTAHSLSMARMMGRYERA